MRKPGTTAGGASPGLLCENVLPELCNEAVLPRACLMILYQYFVGLSWTHLFIIILFPSSKSHGYGTKWVWGCSAGRPRVEDICFCFHPAKTKKVRNMSSMSLKTEISTEHCQQCSKQSYRSHLFFNNLHILSEEMETQGSWMRGISLPS